MRAGRGVFAIVEQRVLLSMIGSIQYDSLNVRIHTRVSLKAIALESIDENLAPEPCSTDEGNV